VSSVAFVGLEEDTICAFCLMTSAGVRMAQDTSSARLDADAWTRAMGRISLPLVLVFHVVNSDFVRSYVVKKAPAAPAVSCCESVLDLHVVLDRHGKVEWLTARQRSDNHAPDALVYTAE
jgi:hypothetical protein